MVTQVITAHVPSALVSRIDKLAEHSERTRAWVIKQALVDVDAGHVIDHDAVMAWANSLGSKKTKALPKK